MKFIFWIAVLLAIAVQTKSITIPLNHHHPIVGGMVTESLLRNQTLELYA